MPVIRRTADCCGPESVPCGAASQPPPPAHPRDRRRPGKRHPPRAHLGRSDRREVRSRVHRRLRPGEGQRGLLLAGPRRAHHGSPGAEYSAGGPNPWKGAHRNGPDSERRGAAGPGRKQQASYVNSPLPPGYRRHWRVICHHPVPQPRSCSRPTWSGRPT